MIISKSFRLDEHIGSGKSISIPNTSGTTQYPIIGKFIVDSLNEVLSNFNAHIEYDEQTALAQMNGVSFYIAANTSSIRAYFDGDRDIGYNSISASYSGNTQAYGAVITVKGTVDSFEVYISAGLNLTNPAILFGKYSLKRLLDGKVLTAFRRNNTTGTFWVFDNGQFLEYAAAIVPDKSYAYSDFTYSGYALIPAVLTNFAYQISDAYLYCPMLESGNHYTIAGVSAVAVQSCLLLKC